MAEKISLYVDKELHRALKAEASLRGKFLSEFMVEAALRILHAPDRRISFGFSDGCVGAGPGGQFFNRFQSKSCRTYMIPLI